MFIVLHYIIWYYSVLNNILYYTTMLEYTHQARAPARGGPFSRAVSRARRVPSDYLLLLLLLLLLMLLLLLLLLTATATATATASTTTTTTSTTAAAAAAATTNCYYYYYY